MIEKQRLEELIEQEANIYAINYWCSDDIEVICLKKSFKTNGSQLLNENGNVYQLQDDSEDVYVSGKNYENLYEHKADAEWELVFGNVEKRIKFVKPKSFIEIDNERDYVYDAHGFQMYIYSVFINVYEVYNGYTESSIIFHKPFNEQNYTEACRLIKKLFMGEE